MSDTKLLQTLIDGQHSIKKNVTSLEKKVEKGFKYVNERLDIIGTSAAQLEDDSPSIEEHENLEKRVGKLEKQVTSN